MPNSIRKVTATPRPGSGGRRLRGILNKASLAAVSLALLWGAACSSGESASETSAVRGQRSAAGIQRAEERALSVRAHRVSRRPVSTYVVANTTLEAVRHVMVYSRLNTLVSELLVEEGDSVREGQTLARLDDREIRNEFEQAQIAVEQARLAVRQAEVKAQLSSHSFQRALSLFEQRLTSREEFDQAGLMDQTDALALDNAQRQLEGATSRLEAAGMQLEYTTVASPITGVITERLVDVGTRVNVGEALYAIQEFPPLWARIFVPERALPDLRVGQPSRVRVETYPDRAFEGRIRMISPTVDVSSGTVRVTIELAQHGHLLRPGMFGTVHIATQTRPDAVVVPRRALLRERDQTFVFVILEDDTVAKREVTTGFSEEDLVEVLEGVREGEAVVTVGVETLNDGYPVMVQSWTDGSGVVVAAPEPASAPRTTPRAESGPESPVRRDSPSDPPDQAEARRWAGGERLGGPDQRGQMFERMMQDPEIRKRWEARLREDPTLESDPEKRRAFVRELMAEMRQRADN
jgi:membrane fusion protein, multidrug efflux system